MVKPPSPPPSKESLNKLALLTRKILDVKKSDLPKPTKKKR